MILNKNCGDGVMYAGINREIGFSFSKLYKALGKSRSELEVERARVKEDHLERTQYLMLGGNYIHINKEVTL